MTFSSTPLEKQYVEISGLNMAYAEMGESGSRDLTFIFLHGNPTSSYLWRNIMPHVAKLGRCLAPDLIGMGDSDKLPNANAESYRFVEHRAFLDGWMEAVIPNGKVVLVIHDWGSALGFDWARRNSERIAGICYMEAIVCPISITDFPQQTRPIFEAFRSKKGEELILERNMFIERVLPGSILRNLNEEEMSVYRAPFIEAGENRRPTLTWPRQIPFDGTPKDVHQIVSDYAQWMKENDIPKLFVNADPGAILLGLPREFCRSWKNQQEITVKGSHFIQEDSPGEIGEALKKWILSL